MHRLTFCVIVLSTILSASILSLQNNARIEGKIISIDKNYLYIIHDKTLFAIENKVIRTVDSEDFESFSNRYPIQKGHNINFDAFEEIVDIDESRIFSKELYQQILQHFPNLNPQELPFEPPPDPALNIYNYFAVKPIRLLHRWTDFTYGHRFIKYQTEWRISLSHLPSFESGELAAFLLSGASDLISLTNSLRYYFNPNCRGFFSGIGYSTTTVTIDDAKLFWGIIKTDDEIKFKLNGAILESGFTGFVGNHVTITSTLAFFIGNTTYKSDDHDEKLRNFTFLPSLNFSVGYGF